MNDKARKQEIDMVVTHGCFSPKRGDYEKKYNYSDIIKLWTIADLIFLRLENIYSSDPKLIFFPI